MCPCLLIEMERRIMAAVDDLRQVVLDVGASIDAAIAKLASQVNGVPQADAEQAVADLQAAKARLDAAVAQ